MDVRNMKTIALSAVIALTLMLGGGVALHAAQSGGGMGGGGPMEMGPMPAYEGGAYFDPPTLPKIVERDLASNCDRFYYLLSHGYYDPFYDRCQYGNSTQDYSVDYRKLGYFYTGLVLTATVGTDPGACGTESQIVVSDGAIVYFCYTAQNTGNITLPLHSLADNTMGTVFSAEPYSLAPGATVSSVDLGAVISETASGPSTHTGSWTGYVSGGVSASANASASVDVAAIELTKTVWLNPDLTQCAPTSVYTTTTNPAWPRYCYTVLNTGNVTLPLHSLVDSELGTIFSGAAVDLGPGQSYFTTTQVTSGVTQTVSNVGTWTASVGGVDATGVATATLVITP